MMCVTPSRSRRARSRARSDKSTTICVLGAATGSRPIARCPAAARRVIRTRPTNPLEPVTSVAAGIMHLFSQTGSRSGSSQHLPHERHDLAAVKLDAAHHLLVRERPRAVFHVEAAHPKRLHGPCYLAGDRLGRSDVK